MISITYYLLYYQCYFECLDLRRDVFFRHDSDILRRHGHVIQDEQNYTLPTIHEIKKKKKLAAWFVSHCKTSGHRESLVKALRKYIPVDVYGACGNLTCKRTPLKPSSKVSHRQINAGENHPERPSCFLPNCIRSPGAKIIY